MNGCYITILAIFGAIILSNGTLAAQTTVTDAAGTQEIWQFEENRGHQRLTSRVNLVDGKGIVQTWDGSSRLISKTDSEGRTTTYRYYYYDSYGPKLSMTEAVGTPQERITYYQYHNADLRLVSKVTTPSVYAGRNKTINTGYDSNNRVSSVTIRGYAGPSKVVTRSSHFVYDLDGRITQIDGPRTDISDVTLLTYYDCDTGFECGQLHTVTNAAGHVSRYDAYDGASRLTKSTGPNGVVTHYTYHPRGWLLSMVQTPPLGAARVTTYEYDNIGQVIKAVLPDGTTQHFSYDDAHDLREISDNLGNKISYTYDAKGNRTHEIVSGFDGALVRSTITGYNHRNFIASINNGGSVTQLINDAVGNVSDQTDPNVNPTTNHSFDALNRLTTTVDALTNNVSYQYDIADQLTQVTAPNGAVTQYEYDDLGNKTKEISPDRGTIVYKHDAAGNIVSMTDARGIITNYQYDALNRLINVNYPTASENLSYVYDAGCEYPVGRLCQSQDDSGSDHYDYDAWGNVVYHEKTEIDQSDVIIGVYTTSYQYDNANRVIQTTYPSGRGVTITRDAIGRLENLTTINDTAVTNSIINKRLYRADGLWTEQTYGNGLVQHKTYDLQGRLVEHQAGNYNRQYSFDANGNITNASSALNNFDTDYSYDSLDRLAKTNNLADNLVTQYVYDENGNREQEKIGELSSSLEYLLNTNRLDNIDGAVIELDASGNTLVDNQGRRYEYNDAGRIHRVLINNAEVGRYVYNAQQLRTQKYSGDQLTVYHYDLTGNLIAESVAGEVVQEYIYADGERVATLVGTTQDNKVTNSDKFYVINKHTGLKLRPVDASNGSAIIATDASDNSNWTRYRQVTRSDGYFYLKNVETGMYFRPITSSDGSGLEQRPTSYSGTRTQWTLNRADRNHQFLVNRWTGKHIRPNTKAEGGSVVQQPNTWTGNWTRWRLEPVPAVTETTTAMYYYHNDHLGTPQMLTDENQQVVWQATYTPFGEALITTELVTNDLRFPGQYFDEETELHYNHFRYYDPSTGRYITSDRIGLGDGPNTYAYVKNNPLMYTDPTGQYGLVGAGYGAIAGGIGGYISGGWQGAVAGAATGALVGAVNPFAANTVGAAAGAGVASLLGQGAGNLVAGNDVTDICNYDFSAAAGAALGGALGGPLGSVVGRYVAPYRSRIIGNLLNSRGINYIPGRTAGAIAEGTTVGVGEVVGQQF